MKKHSHLSDQNHFLARLSHLAAFQGAPNWSFNSSHSVSHAPEAKRQGVSRYLVGIKKALLQLKNRIAEEQQFRTNIRELRSLSDHTLRDIGLHRGDIAALSSRSQQFSELNELREELARPACQVVDFTPPKPAQAPVRQLQLIDNAA